jgi:hypothetical protein
MHRAYPSRYYVLAVTCLLAAMQILAWVTFSPIADEAKEWYGLTDDEITLLPSKPVHLCQCLHFFSSLQSNMLCHINYSIHLVAAKVWP